MPAIEVARLAVRFGDVQAVAGVSFTVDNGEVVALLGPNGAGKTTTVETLEGYRSPTSGTVRVLGLDPVADHGALAPKVGVMLQEGGVYPGIRPLEAVELFASYYDRPADPVELLERVGLGERRSVACRRLSGGERQRLSLALALVGQPEVAFLDEPTAGIDVTGRRLVRAVIGELRRRAAVLVTTHDLDEAERIADRIVIIDRGRVLVSGTPAELVRSPDGGEILFAARPGLDRIGMGQALSATVEEMSPGEYRAALAPTPSNVAALTAWLAERDLALGDLRAGRQRLEDVFTRLTEADAEPREDAGAGPRAAPGHRARRRRHRR
ncbi:MAG: ABC transporter ATP-binding protein [Acidimicrobiia bacterium]